MIRRFLIRLANHSPAVAPPVFKPAFSGFRIASATVSLRSSIGSRTVDSPGRVKNTRDQRVCLLCSPGGWLNAYYEVSEFAWVQAFREIFAYTMRWRLDFSIPPLKITIASPAELNLARKWERYQERPNRDCRSRVLALANWSCGQSLYATGLQKITLTYCHSSVPGTITWRPPSRLCRKDWMLLSQ